MNEQEKISEGPVVEVTPAHVHGPNCSHSPTPAPYVRMGEKVGRNDPCPCGSKQKFKKCHGH